jgi:hypothetical protein
MANDIDYRNRFQQICEMTFVGNGGLLEDGDGVVDDTQNGDGAPQGEGAGDGSEMPADMGQMFGAPEMGGDDMGGAAPMGSDEGGAAQPPQGFNPQMNAMGAPEGEVPSEDDDVVDITDLVDSQDDIDNKISAFDKKFDKAMAAIDQFTELIKDNNAKIGDLKAEFERRNPTQVEKMNIQTSKSYPFSQTVDEFWKDKEKTSNYSTEPDNNGKEQGQYVITGDDVNGSVDWKTISDSMNDDDDDWMYNQNLSYMMKI